MTAASRSCGQGSSDDLDRRGLPGAPSVREPPRIQFKLLRGHVNGARTLGWVIARVVGWALDPVPSCVYERYESGGCTSVVVVACVAQPVPQSLTRAVIDR